MGRFSAVGVLCLLTCLVTTGADHVQAQTLTKRLSAEDPVQLAGDARKLGDARRGAIVFYQPFLSCTRCHTTGKDGHRLGPELTRTDQKLTDTQLVQSVLDPSRVIKKGYETITVVTSQGRTIAGLLVEDRKQQLVLRDPTSSTQIITIDKSQIEQRNNSGPSIMPQGVVDQLASRQQFLDLLKYLIEIRSGGPARALALRPDPSLYAPRPLPEYEKTIDHAGMISDLNRQSFERGQAIYNRLCINCHGTHDRPGTLPTSLRFATGKFKNGSDPYTMYQTLTKGFGMMVPQMWMVPQQKYDVIHYIREAYLKQHNPEQYVELNADYLSALPAGDGRGPQPSQFQPWENMDYGPNLVATYEVGNDGANFAYKGNAVRLDAGPGGVTRGRYWSLFDYDTLRTAASWSGRGFIDFNGINFNGRHGIHPRIVGDVAYANPAGPGWARPGSDSLEDPRLRGRDGKPYGPLPRDWAHYKGMYYYRNRVVISYTVGKTQVLELPGLQETAAGAAYTRTFQIGPRSQEMLLRVARAPQKGSVLKSLRTSNGLRSVTVGKSAAEQSSTKSNAFSFDGRSYLNVADARAFDLLAKDYTIQARIKTRRGGTIVCKTADGAEWVPDGKTLFVRQGRLCFDIGWVGVIQSRSRVNDGRWHDVAITYAAADGRVQLFVDGRPDGDGRLQPKKPVNKHVLRIGYTAANFPRGQSYFVGSIEQVRFYNRVLTVDELQAQQLTKSGLIGYWSPAQIQKQRVSDLSGQKHHAQVRVGVVSDSTQSNGLLAAGTTSGLVDPDWSLDAAQNLLLRLPAGKTPLRFTLWLASTQDDEQARNVASALTVDRNVPDLSTYTQGGPPRWPDKIQTTIQRGDDTGPFAVDVLTHPETNPWFCRVRLTGLDFYPDGDTAIVSAWEGSVWRVTGLNRTDGVLQWQRIASGLFQPLGVKIVQGRIYVTCRDQIVILHDLNGDHEIDYFENFNNDHQVTDHFHEFAMGLQTDEQGNFYYAKSARHALKALVPHHGTLLRVSPDGSRTDILANGFRAANGVCVNPDGTFIVTDQEGHWNPKNRINWVREGGFYGNMFGYHDVTDSSDAAMQQPLCWITNAFDRSPAELLWVDSPRWGPLSNSLLNLSYGYGKVYVVPHEQVDGQMQGGMCQLSIPQFPTGVMRGRFHPADGQLYVCGMFAWAGSQHRPGGFYRLRYTGKPVHLPVGLKARKSGMELQFSGGLERKSATQVSNYAVKVWSLKRTANYGSKHYNEHALKVTEAVLAADGKTVLLRMPELGPTWCMEIKYAVKASDGKPVSGVIHNTIHKLGP